MFAARASPAIARGTGTVRPRLLRDASGAGRALPRSRMSTPRRKPRTRRPRASHRPFASSRRPGGITDRSRVSDETSSLETSPFVAAATTTKRICASPTDACPTRRRLTQAFKKRVSRGERTHRFTAISPSRVRANRRTMTSRLSTVAMAGFDEMGNPVGRDVTFGRGAGAVALASTLRKKPPSGARSKRRSPSSSLPPRKRRRGSRRRSVCV